MSNQLFCEDPTFAQDFKCALARDELSIFLQPKVDTRSTEVVGAEILSRWPNPRYTHLSQDDWILMVENYGLMREFTHWLVHKVVTKLKDSQHGTSLPLSINVPPTVMDDAMIDFILKTLDQADVSPHLLEVEMTESSPIPDFEVVKKAMRRLKVGGVQVSLDDFGAGFSSMRYLVELPVDTVKFDKSIIQQATYDPCARLILSSLVGLAHEINLKVVCEGVETLEQHAIALQAGCDQIQGYLHGRPMPIETASVYLKGGSTKPRSLRECS